MTERRRAGPVARETISQRCRRWPRSVATVVSTATRPRPKGLVIRGDARVLAVCATDDDDACVGASR